MGFQRRSSRQKVSTYSPCIAATGWCLRGCLFFFTSSNLIEATSKLLSIKDRQLLISGLVGEYQFLCHDCQDDDDMSIAESCELYASFTDSELIADSMIGDVELYSSVQDYYNNFAAYLPKEYLIEQ